MEDLGRLGGWVSKMVCFFFQGGEGLVFLDENMREYLGRLRGARVDPKTLEIGDDIHCHTKRLYIRLETVPYQSRP